MEAIPKSNIKSHTRFGNRFDIRLKQTTWIGHMHSLKGKITCFFLNNHSFYVRKFRGLTSQHHQSQKNIRLCLLLFLLLQ